MASVSVPAGLTVKEYWVAALAEAADALRSADNVDGFLSAIEVNHGLWSILAETAGRFPGTVDKRATDFVMSTAYGGGRGIPDRNVEMLIGINNTLSSTLAGEDDPALVRRRAELVWKKAAPGGMGLNIWLVQEIDRMNRLTGD
jgi:hypothetical protein